MRILFLDPFHGGSHAAVAEGYARHSRHDVTLLTLSIAGGWRWRMRGAAVTLARRLREMIQQHSYAFDLIVTTDMLDLATFLGLTRDLTHGIPTAVYFHENQLTYPLPPGRVRDLSFPWMNYTSALVADLVLFNSDFHRQVFLRDLPGLPGRYHDHQELDLIEHIATKSHVLPPGIDLARLDMPEPGNRNTSPTILWNSRWEYDKQPQAFFDALQVLDSRGGNFRIIVAGEHIDPNTAEFVAARTQLSPRILSWGYVEDLASYRALLWQADIVVSTAIQEFFGISLVEAMYCGCLPIAPRRLSYPELIPAQYQATCLYADQTDLIEKLSAALANLAELRAYDFRSVAAKYSWDTLAPRYDDILEHLHRIQK